MIWPRMNKAELENLLEELDEALCQQFPKAEPISLFVVGGACLVFSGVTARQTRDIDVIIIDMMGQGPESLVYDLSRTGKKVRSTIERIGRAHGLRGSEKCFVNDDCSSFLLEIGQGEIPDFYLFKAYRKILLHFPTDLGYILACKLMAARPEKDLDDIAVLRQRLGVNSRAQAQAVVDRFFPSREHQRLYELPRTLKALFPQG